MNAHALQFLQDLAVVLLAAGAVAVLFRRLRLPVVLGYILAGLLVGPHTPPYSFIQDEETIRTLADLGVILLLFSLGLEFRLRKLREVGGTAFLAASLEIVLMIWVGYELGQLFGWGEMDSLFLGAMLSISSTTIIVKALRDLGLQKERFATITMGILIVEDILAIVLIALLSGIALAGELHTTDALLTFGKVGVFLAVTLVLGILSIPRFLSFVGRFKNDEILLVAVLGICFGLSLLAVKLGYSAALGAFLAGAIIAESREIGKIETLAQPVRDMFSAIFFVAVGLLIDPAMIAQHWVAVLVITAAVVVGKILSCSGGAFLTGNDPCSSLRIGMSLAQIGEFSFIIASLGLTLGVTSAFLYPIAVAVSALTTLLTPVLIQASNPMALWIRRCAPSRFIRTLELYYSWIRQISEKRARDSIRKNLRKLVLQLAINALLLAAVFSAAAFLARNEPEWLPPMPETWGGKKTLLWLGAMLAGTPLYVAAILKLRNIGTLLSKMSVRAAAAKEDTEGLRAIIASTILMAGIGGLGLLTLLLSAAILPPPRVLLVLLVLVFAFSVLLWNRLAKIYAKARHALEETLARPDGTAQHGAREAEPSTLPAAGEFAIEVFEIGPGCPAAGKLLRDFTLRTSTGTSIVGILRENERLFNPGPDEELLPGDKLLLLGAPEQMKKARKSLEKGLGIPS